MEADMETTRVITLTLNEVEFAFLKAVMQNPIGCEKPCDEEIGNKKMRSKFWETLNLLGME